MPSSFPMIPEPPSSTYPHEYWMAEAIREARKAEEIGEVPIGAIIVRGDEIVDAATIYGRAPLTVPPMRK
ncbi:hypothetical protein HMSSN139_61880 [Paenibacillus sp. HMSSN-139]|nr:hypothetical protein HMSSN139_61880 [Paenibacillus sp. HMSSN-139]